MDLNKELLKKLQDSSQYKDLAEELATMIRVRVRKGYGVDDHLGKEEKFKPLKESTIKARKRMKARGDLLTGEGVSRSNLTATGEMTDAISGKAERGQLSIYMKGKRNQNLSAYHEVKDRPFFHISEKEHKKIMNLIRARVKEIIRSLQSTKK